MAGELVDRERRVVIGVDSKPEYVIPSSVHWVVNKFMKVFCTMTVTDRSLNIAGALNH